MAKCIFESSIQYVNANIDEMLYGVTIPPHLLFLGHALRNDLVDRRLGEAGRYPGSCTVAPAVIRHRIRVQFEISNQVEQRFIQLRHGREVSETRCCRALLHGSGRNWLLWERLLKGCLINAE